MFAVVCRKEIDCVFLRKISDNHHVVVRVDVQILHLYVASSNFQFRNPADRHLEV